MRTQPSGFGGLFSARRIVVVGANGAGKTWFANRLSAALGCDVTHNDALALTTQWAHREKADIRLARDAIAAREAWIIEGGPSTLSGVVLDRAQVTVWLDMPRWVRVRRVLWRSVVFMGRQRPEHPTGNREWPGRRQTRFIAKTWTSDAAMRRAIAAGLERCAGQILHLVSPAEVPTLLAHADRVKAQTDD